jgi:signal transduction histidine kinase
VALVTDELDRMARIVDDLLMLAKAEQPDFVHRTPTEIEPFTRDLFARAQALGDRRWVCEAAATGTVALDEQRLVQAVLNLVRNSVEHTGPGDEIGIGTRQADGELSVWVRDTGSGVDPKDHERIFERFARAGASARRSDGAGLGLAIVTSVAVAHGGRVVLESSPGHGSTFRIVLPAIGPDTSASAHDRLVEHRA